MIPVRRLREAESEKCSLFRPVCPRCSLDADWLLASGWVRPSLRLGCCYCVVVFIDGVTVLETCYWACSCLQIVHHVFPLSHDNTDIKKQQRYSVIDNTGFEDPRLSYKAKGLLGYFHEAGQLAG